MNINKIISMYIDDKKSTYEIANELNTYPNKIRRILIKNGIVLNDKSKAQKNALEKGVAKIPTAGRKRSEVEKLKISESLQKKWDNISEEQYEMRVSSARSRWNSMGDMAKEKMSIAATKAIQKAGKEGSKLEKYLKYEISKYGYKIEFHKKNLIPNANLEIDMYFPEVKAIIEIDGPSHFLPIWGEEKLQKQIKADANKTGLILSKGFVIIRVKNLSDSLSLKKQNDLKNKLIELLDELRDTFPPLGKRYIEIET